MERMCVHVCRLARPPALGGLPAGDCLLACLLFALLCLILASSTHLSSPMVSVPIPSALYSSPRAQPPMTVMGRISGQHATLTPHWLLTSLFLLDLICGNFLSHVVLCLLCFTNPPPMVTIYLPYVSTMYEVID